ncbi:hypothetical protein BDZ94DRAFT_1249234 [Collybia nuda]|uniref:Uncharacterized protein n=1 Tax=Collybia nuda TaxID=64659 RepID=A0A9P6CP76_9AGAR|nr:hypothetical protein BDZ94DRAFT_1249234 [Collybia nuda]
MLFESQKQLMVVVQNAAELQAEVNILQKGRFLPEIESRSQSLSPSDSVSQVPSAFRSTSPNLDNVRPAARPPHLSFEVLWNIEDCQNDPLSAQNKANYSHPLMILVIRNADGSLIAAEKYHNIWTNTAALVSANLQGLPPPANDPTRVRKNSRFSGDIDIRTISWYKICYPTQLSNVIQALERMHPELQLCSGNWKAEHMLMQYLNSCNSTVCSPHSSTTGKGKERARRLSQASSDGSRHAGPSASVPRPQVTPSHDDPLDNQDGHANSTKRPRSDSDCTTTLALKKLRAGDAVGSLQVMNDIDIIDDLATLDSTSPALISHGDYATPIPTVLTTSTTPTNSTEMQINIAFISVDPSLTNLIDIFNSEFPMLKAAAPLLDCLTAMAATERTPRETSPEVLAFISRIENADPNCLELDEDNTNAGWGRRQFTAGFQTVASVLVSWDVIGSVASACRLISASIKTCRVARHICRERGIQAESFMSDVYLDRVVETLCTLTAGQIPQQSQVPTSSTPTLPLPPPPKNAPASQPLANNHQRKALQVLVVEDLKVWIKDHAITVPQRNPKKANLISAILMSNKIPSSDEINALLNQRKGKRGATLP